MADVDQHGSQLEQLLDHEQCQNRIQQGISVAKTQHQCQLRAFIGQRIQDFSHMGYHMEAPGDLTVQGIRQTGKGHDPACQEVVLPGPGIPVQLYIHRDQCQTEQTQQIRYRQYFFFPVPGKHKTPSFADRRSRRQCQ